MTETPTDSLVFKQATESWEFGEVHRLNYDTFVEEIPQHEPNTDRRLVDKFHSENVYFVCLSGRELLGMVAVRGKRPFSLDQKLENLDSYLPAGRTVCEIRLLSVRPNRRNGHVFHGLLRTVLDYCIPAGYDMAVISGTVRQDRLYRHLGFVPFGPRVGAGAALYQPMYLTAEAFDATALKMRETRPTTAVTDGRPGPGTEDRSALPASFLPGPVNVHPDVMAALSGAPVSHRSESFIRDVAETRRMLRDLTGAQHVEILQGSGTLANETVAGELACSGERGLLLSNGEFGGRLIDHATRWQLDFSVLSSDWGAPFDYAELERALHADPDVRWVWCAHCETSTGVLNDLERLETCCRKRNVDLCLDAISSVGTVPVNLRHVRLASCVSGKGLAAFPGLAIVFCVESHATPRRSLPRYIDLSYYAEKSGIPFTLSSNLLHALQAALKRLSPTERFEHIRQVGAWLRGELRAQGFHIVAADDHASPAVVTIALPEGLDSGTVGRAMEAQGIIVSYNSERVPLEETMDSILPDGGMRADRSRRGRGPARGTHALTAVWRDTYGIDCNGSAMTCWTEYDIGALERRGLNEAADRVCHHLEESMADNRIVGGMFSGTEMITWSGAPCGYEGLLQGQFRMMLAVARHRRWVPRFEPKWWASPPK